MVSFEIGSLTRPPSFPRKRESSLQKSHSVKCVEWIPAFAGMTCGLDLPYHSNDTTTERLWPLNMRVCLIHSAMMAKLSRRAR